MIFFLNNKEKRKNGWPTSGKHPHLSSPIVAGCLQGWWADMCQQQEYGEALVVIFLPPFLSLLHLCVGLVKLQSGSRSFICIEFDLVVFLISSMDI
jgi:hypothetical protein